MRLHHIAIVVADLDKSIAFYKEFFQGKLIKSFERPDLGGKAAWLEFDNYIVEIWEFKDAKNTELENLQTKGIRHLAFGVSDLNKIVGGFRSRGLEVSEPATGASGKRYSFVTDPDGIPVELLED